MRWMVFSLACAMQGAGLVLLCRSGWFSSGAKTIFHQTYPAAAAKAVRNALVVFGSGAVAMLFFALWEHHSILALGQLAASALCLLGGRIPNSETAPGGNSRKTGLL